LALDDTRALETRSPPEHEVTNGNRGEECENLKTDWNDNTVSRMVATKHVLRKQDLEYKNCRDERE